MPPKWIDSIDRIVALAAGVLVVLFGVEVEGHDAYLHPTSMIGDPLTFVIAFGLIVCGLVLITETLRQ